MNQCENLCENGEIYVDHEIGTTFCDCIEGKKKALWRRYTDVNPLCAEHDELTTLGAKAIRAMHDEANPELKAELVNIYIHLQQRYVEIGGKE